MTESQRPTHCQGDGCANTFALDDRGQPQYRTLPVIEAGKVRTRYLCPDCWQAWRDSVRAKLARTAATVTATAPSDGRRIASPGICENNRFVSPRNCDPAQRPHDRRVPR